MPFEGHFTFIDISEYRVYISRTLPLTHMSEVATEYPHGLQLACEFIDAHTSARLSSRANIQSQTPTSLPDGRLMSAEYWKYASADLQAGGKCDLSTRKSCLSPSTLQGLAETLLEKGEIHLVTGSDDCVVSIRISLAQPSGNPDARVPTDEVRAAVKSVL